MSYFCPKPFRFFSSIRSFVEHTPEPAPSRLLWTSIHGEFEKEELVSIREGTINLVLHNKIRRNIRESFRVACDIAEGKGGVGPEEKKNVLYINTFSKLTLLRELAQLQMKQGAADDAAHAESPQDQGQPLPTLHLIDCPTGELSVNIHQLHQKIKEHKINVLIVNSFEFTSLTYRQKEKCAQAFVDMESSYGITVIVFSTEIRKDIEAGSSARGPIGLLAAVSESVSRIAPEFASDLPSKKKKGSMESENEGVHENGTDTDVNEQWSSGNEEWTIDNEQWRYATAEELKEARETQWLPYPPEMEELFAEKAAGVSVDPNAWHGRPRP